MRRLTAVLLILCTLMMAVPARGFLVKQYLKRKFG